MLTQTLIRNGTVFLRQVRLAYFNCLRLRKFSPAFLLRGVQATGLSTDILHPIRQPAFFALLNPARPARLLWCHRDLLWQFTVRTVEMRHKGSLLGIVWSILNPLLLLALYVFVFGFIFEGRFGEVPDETRLDYALGIFLGLSIFHLIAETVGAAPMLIVGNPNFVKKVVFPLEILPASAVGAATIHMLVSLTMVLVGTALFGRGLNPGMILLPLVIMPVVGIALGLSWIISAVGVFFRDVGQLTAAMITALMFSSAVFYSSSRIPEAARFLVHVNPLIEIIEVARNLVIWNRSVDFADIVAINIWGAGVSLVGFACFCRLKSAFADVI